MASSSQPFDLLLALSILYGLVIVGVVAVVLTALIRVPSQYGSTLREIFRQTRFLELTTVLVIIISATYLALTGKMTEGAVSLLSGIAGYVLGGLASNKAVQSGRATGQGASTGDTTDA